MNADPHRARSEIRAWPGRIDPRYLLAAALAVVAIAAGVALRAHLRRPIRVGFVAELTERHADLGVQGRNGAHLAVEAVNRAGGIGGRPLELIVRDDRGTPEGARQADRELLEAGVVAIIGHMTSVQAAAGMSVIEELGGLLLSPTSSSASFSGIEDRFFRITSSNAEEAVTLAQHAYENRSTRRVAALMDSHNAAFSQVLWDTFATRFAALGGVAGPAIAFSSQEDPDYAALAGAALEAEPDAVLLIASAFDTAMLAQRLRREAPDIPLLSSGWAHSDLLLQYGGHAVEGIEFIMPYRAESTDPVFVAFREHYLARFGSEPTFAATFSYDAVMALAAALHRTRGRREGLESALLEIGVVHGAAGEFSFDRYGDAVRDLYLSVVRDGAFVTIATFPSPVKP